MSEKITDNLKSLKAVSMSSARQSAQRDFLLSKISGQSFTSLSGFRIFLNYFNQPFIFKPLAYLSAILLLLLLGTGYTMSAASHSLPGNTFYPVKLSWEKLQLSLVPDEVDRTKKQIEFASRRLNELSTVAEGVSSPVEKQAQVAQAVRHFNDSIREVKTSLEKAAAQAPEENSDLVEVARFVNDKSQAFEQTLVGYYPDLPVTVKSVVEQEVADIKYQSLELLVDRYDQNNSLVSKDLIFEQLQEKIIANGAWASALAEASLTQEALEKLNKLQELLEQSEFKQVLAGLNDFIIYQESVSNPAAESAETGEVLGAAEGLEIEVATNTTTSTEPIVQPPAEQD